MTTYKAIHGKLIQALAADPDSAAYEGQIWFNTTSSDYKTITKAAGAWGTGGNLNTAKRYGSTAGTQTAGLYFGGSPGSTIAEETEEYNGSAWTAGGDLNTARYDTTGFGTQTAGVCVGGTGDTDATEEYNGTSWTAVINLPTARAAVVIPQPAVAPRA